MSSGNLFVDAAPPKTGERFDVLLRHGNLVVERIVSSVEKWCATLLRHGSATNQSALTPRTKEQQHG